MRFFLFIPGHILNIFQKNSLQDFAAYIYAFMLRGGGNTVWGQPTTTHDHDDVMAAGLQDNVQVWSYYEYKYISLVHGQKVLSQYI